MTARRKDRRWRGATTQLPAPLSIHSARPAFAFSSPNSQCLPRGFPDLFGDKTPPTGNPFVQCLACRAQAGTVTLGGRGRHAPPHRVLPCCCFSAARDRAEVGGDPGSAWCVGEQGPPSPSLVSHTQGPHVPNSCACGGSVLLLIRWVRRENKTQIFWLALC